MRRHINRSVDTLVVPTWCGVKVDLQLCLVFQVAGVRQVLLVRLVAQHQVCSRHVRRRRKFEPRGRVHGTTLGGVRLEIHTQESVHARQTDTPGTRKQHGPDFIGKSGSTYS